MDTDDIVDFLPDKSEETRKQLQNFIVDFSLSIGDKYDVAMTIPHGSTLIQVHQIYFCKPQLVMIEGTVGDDPVRVVQSLAQLNFALHAVKRENPEKPKNSIGFHSGYPA